MTSLPQLIKFRSLADQLNDREFTDFINKMVCECGRDVILTSLFHQFTDGTTHKLNPRTLSTAIEIIEGIIKKREGKHESVVESTSLNSITSVLIGEIGSYLHQREHMDFSKCCRSTYLGLNTPNTLRGLFLRVISDYSLVNPLKYTQVTRLYVPLSKFKEFAFPIHQTAFPRLTKLTITNEENSDADLDWLSNCRAIEWNNITHLCLEDFGDGFPKAKILKLVSLFPNLILLHFHGAYFEWKSNTKDDHLWAPILPKLQIFVDTGSHYNSAESIIRSRSNQLRLLSLCGGRHNLSVDLDLSSVVEVDCASPLDKNTIKIIRSLKNSLERIYFDFSEGMVKDDMNRISDVLFGQNLQQCAISAPNSKLEEICAVWERKIVECTDSERKCLQLKLRMDIDAAVDASEIMFQASRVVSRLHESEIKDYLFSLALRDGAHKQDDQDWDKMLSKFAAKNAQKYDISFSPRNLMISRKDSKISGCIQNYFVFDWLLNTRMGCN